MELFESFGAVSTLRKDERESQGSVSSGPVVLPPRGGAVVAGGSRGGAVVVARVGRVARGGAVVRIS